MNHSRLSINFSDHTRKGRDLESREERHYHQAKRDVDRYSQSCDKPDSTKQINSERSQSLNMCWPDHDERRKERCISVSQIAGSAMANSSITSSGWQPYKHANEKARRKQNKIKKLEWREQSASRWSRRHTREQTKTETVLNSRPPISRGEERPASAEPSGVENDSEWSEATQPRQEGKKQSESYAEVSRIDVYQPTYEGESTNEASAQIQTLWTRKENNNQTQTNKKRIESNNKRTKRATKKDNEAIPREEKKQTVQHHTYTEVEWIEKKKQKEQKHHTAEKKHEHLAHHHYQMSWWWLSIRWWEETWWGAIHQIHNWEGEIKKMKKQSRCATKRDAKSRDWTWTKEEGVDTRKMNRRGREKGPRPEKERVSRKAKTVNWQRGEIHDRQKTSSSLRDTPNTLCWFSL